LRDFVSRLLTRRIDPTEIAEEFRAQYGRFCDLIGHPPSFVSTHHHVQVFPPVGPILLDLLKEEQPRPYLRKVQEPWHMLVRIPGARTKRTVLTVPGRRLADLQDAVGLPGNDWLAGITDPPLVRDSKFLVRWVRRVPGQVVELSCHPGHIDPTLIGRDC